MCTHKIQKVYTFLHKYLRIYGVQCSIWKQLIISHVSVADPGFPIVGGTDPLGGHRPPTCTLFGENVCEN